MTTSPVSVNARDVRVTLGRRDVLAGISLDCEPGRITGLLGPNGAGKSTLLRALAGIVPLAGGSIDLAGQALSDVSPRDRGRRIAYLPQHRAVHWPLAVRHVVALGRLPHRGTVTSATDDHAIDEALRAMDVAALGDRSVAELSGGELARVLFARALAQEAPVILADEPTAGLDPAHALGLFELLGHLAAAGRTIVIALHDISLAARFCHEVVMLTEGRVAASGPPSRALTGECLEKVFGVRMAVGTVCGVPVIVPQTRDAPSDPPC